jgi:hypothetical protein
MKRIITGTSLLLILIGVACDLLELNGGTININGQQGE